MKQTIATTPEQSARLKACGVDPKTADVFWRIPITAIQKKLGENCLFAIREGQKRFPTDIPAYSLSRLLEIVPAKIQIKSDGIGVLFFFRLLKVSNNNRYAYEASYFSGMINDFIYTNSSSDPIEACVKAIEWLTENGYKLNKIEE